MESTGTVEYINVSNFRGQIKLRVRLTIGQLTIGDLGVAFAPAPGFSDVGPIFYKIEEFLIWDGEPTNIKDRIIHSMHLSMLQKALLERLKVTIAHDGDPALITDVGIEAPQGS